MDFFQTPLTKSEFDGCYEQLQTFALKATKNAAGLPADLAFHRHVDSDLAKELEACSSKVASITNMLLSLTSTIGSSMSSKGKGKAHLQDEDDFVDRFGALIVEPMDQLLERAVRSVPSPFALLSPYSGYCARPILWQDESPCHYYWYPRAKKEGRPARPPESCDTICTAHRETAAPLQKKV
jgi:PMC2NT (NUC016) domain